MIGHFVAVIFQKVFLLMLLFPLIIRYGCIQTSSKPGPFTVNTHRAFQDANEEQLIGIAESACPNQADVVALCPQLETGERCRWWCSDLDGIAIPHAITAEAVQYYIDLIHKFEDAATENPRDSGMLSASVGYRAAIERHEVWRAGEQSFSGVYVVSMELTWKYLCGPLCAMGFDMNRTVVLDPDGHVLSVSGDGEPDLWVS